MKRLDVVTSVDSVNMEPIRMARFEHGGSVYKLREPVPFNIEFADGVWAYGNAGLGLRGYAKRRDEALRELHEAFDYAYREIVMEDDDALDGKAIELKRRLLSLVETAQPADEEPA